jgi:hypothetical protein
LASIPGLHIGLKIPALVSCGPFFMQKFSAEGAGGNGQSNAEEKESHLKK